MAEAVPDGRTGAHLLVDELLDAGIEVCFTNPGTSEIHFVAALDDRPAMRSILCLFEGVASGAADGYFRVTGRPAATLLHLGPGLANGLANFHNARRAHSGVLNIVGDHAIRHQGLDAPLQSDINAVAGWLEGPVYRPGHASLRADTRAAVADSRRAIATLILAADVSWDAPAEALATEAAPAPSGQGVAPDIEGLAALLADDGPATVLLLGGDALTEPGLHAAARIAAATGARVIIETFPAHIASGRGVPNFERLAYPAEHAVAQLAGARRLVLCGAAHPVAFFAYPGLPSDLVAPGTDVVTASGHLGAGAALVAVAAQLGAPTVAPAVSAPPTVPDEPLTVRNWGAVLAAELPAGAIISDEANSSGFLLPEQLAGAARHDVMRLTGGAIGQGLPLAVGAAVAAPDRPVFALQADGSAAYTISALWTMARERLDVTVLLLDNRSYAVLGRELERVGAASSTGIARALLDLSDPAMDFTAIAEGFGVPASRAATTGELAEQIRAAQAVPGPRLISVTLPGPA